MQHAHYLQGRRSHCSPRQLLARKRCTSGWPSCRAGSANDDDIAAACQRYDTCRVERPFLLSLTSPALGHRYQEVQENRGESGIIERNHSNQPKRLGFIVCSSFSPRFTQLKFLALLLRARPFRPPVFSAFPPPSTGRASRKRRRRKTGSEANGHVRADRETCARRQPTRMWNPGRGRG